MDPSAAATIIQSRYRGLSARKSLTPHQKAHLTKCREEIGGYRQGQAATDIQRIYRGHLVREKGAPPTASAHELRPAPGVEKVIALDCIDGGEKEVPPKEAYRTPCCGHVVYLPSLLTYIRQNGHKAVKQDSETRLPEEAQHYCPYCRNSMRIIIDLLKKGIDPFPGAHMNPTFQKIRRRPFAGQMLPELEKGVPDPSELQRTLHRIGLPRPVKSLHSEEEVVPVLRTSSCPSAGRPKRPPKERFERTLFSSEHPYFSLPAKVDPAVMSALAASPLRVIPRKLERLMSVDAVTGSGLKTGLAVAIKRGDLRSVESLLSYGADPNKRDIYGFPPITYLVEQRKIDHYTGLPKSGFGKFPTRKFGEVAYSESDYNCQLFRIAKLLLMNGARLDLATSARCYPLFFAARNNDTELVNLFLAHGAKIDAPNYRHNTALHAAAEHSSFESIPLLLRKGASLLVQNDDGITPFHDIVYPCSSVELIDKDSNPKNIPVLRVDRSSGLLSTKGLEMFIAEAKTRHCLRACVTCPRNKDHKTVIDLMREDKSFSRLLPLVTAAK